MLRPLLTLVFCLFLAAPSLAMEIILDERDSLILDQALPTQFEEQDLTSIVDWLGQDYSSELFLKSTQPNPQASWHKIELKGQFKDDLRHHKILRIETHLFRHLDLYIFTGKTLLSQAHYGLKDSRHPSLQNAEHKYEGPHIALDIKNGQVLTLLIRKQNDGPAILPMTLYSQTQYTETLRRQWLFWGGVIAVLLSMALYNILVYAMHPSKAYIWYMGFHLTAFVYFSALNGFGFLLWSATLQVWLAQNIMLMNFLLIFWVVNFANVFLEAKKNTPTLYKYIPYFSIFSLLGAVTCLFVGETLMIPIFSVFQFLGSVFGIVIGIAALKNKFYPAKYFLLSWFFTISGGAIGMGTFISVLPANFFTLHGFLFGTILELFLLAIALASRLKHAEQKLLSQSFLYPDTSIANFSYFRALFPSYLEKILIKKPKLLMIIANAEGFREAVSLYGPEVLSPSYKYNTERLTEFLQDKNWSVPFSLPSGEPIYLIALPAEQILILVEIKTEDTQQELEKIATQLININAQPFYINDMQIKIHNTLGCSIVTKDKDIKECFRQAQISLLACEQQNKKWLLFNDKQDKSISQRLSLINDLRVAIGQQQMHIFLQPQVNIQSGDVIGAEVLLRWSHPTRGEISPSQFIPLAEQSGLIFSITKMVFGHACQWLTEQNQKHEMENFTLSINLSALDIANPKLLPFIKQTVKKFSLNTQHVLLEITESAAMDNSEIFLTSIHAFKEMGFQISIDDFGTGYSSMVYLQQIQANEIKIDMAFIRNIHKNPTNQKIVHAIIQLAHATGAHTVAEGVEKQAEADFLLKLECECAQGFLWSPAVPTSSFEQQYLNQ